MKNEPEAVRILRAASEERMVTNQHGRWTIIGEARPDRKTRERLFGAGYLDYAFIGPSRVTAYALTSKGRRELEAVASAEIRPSQEGK